VLRLRWWGRRVSSEGVLTVGFVRFSGGGSCVRGGWESKGGSCLGIMVAVNTDKS